MRLAATLAAASMALVVSPAGAGGAKAQEVPKVSLVVIGPTATPGAWSVDVDASGVLTASVIGGRMIKRRLTPGETELLRKATQMLPFRRGRYSFGKRREGIAPAYEVMVERSGRVTSYSVSEDCEATESPSECSRVRTLIGYLCILVEKDPAR